MNVAGTARLSKSQEMLNDPDDILWMFGIELRQGLLILISKRRSGHGNLFDCGNRTPIRPGNVVKTLRRNLADHSLEYFSHGM